MYIMRKKKIKWKGYGLGGRQFIAYGGNRTVIFQSTPLEVTSFPCLLRETSDTGKSADRKKEEERRKKHIPEFTVAALLRSKVNIHINY